MKMAIWPQEWHHLFGVVERNDIEYLGFVEN